MEPTPVTADDRPADATRIARSRDADGTRQLLLDAARRRFARDGYTATTVRDIATDAGVNVALINRYFTSKEGLFEACLRRIALAIDRPNAADMTVDQIIETIIVQLADQTGGEYSLQMLLLLRSSGDDRADQIRRDTIHSFAEGIATAAGWRPGDADDDLLLRAQIALSTALGMVLFRSSIALEPVASASVERLRGPLGEVLSALLAPRS